MNKLPSLTKYDDLKLLSEEEFEALKPEIQGWARSFQMDISNEFAEKINIKSAKLLNKCRIVVCSRYENRKLVQKEKPFIKGETENTGFTVSEGAAFPIWSIPGSSKFNKNELKREELKIKGADSVSECETCDGDGKVVCSDCGGARNVTCPTCNGSRICKCARGIVFGGCGGSGEQQCSHCSGRGTQLSAGNPLCNRCRGTGRIRCHKCAGSGTVTCAGCKGRGEVRCSGCDGAGELTCDGCEGAGAIIKSWYVEVDESDKVSELTDCVYGEIPEAVDKWQAGLSSLQISDIDLAVIDGDFISKYQLPRLREKLGELAKEAHSDINSNEDSAVPLVEGGARQALVRREWVQEYYDPLHEVEYSYGGKEYKLWISKGRQTPEPKPEQLKMPGVSCWRKGMCVFAEESPFAERLSSTAREAQAALKRGDYTLAKALTGGILKISPLHPEARGIRSSIKINHAVYLLAPIAAACLISLIFVESLGEVPVISSLGVYLMWCAGAAAFVKLVAYSGARRSTAIIGSVIGLMLGVGIAGKKHADTAASAVTAAKAESDRSDAVKRERQSTVSAQSKTESQEGVGSRDSVKPATVAAPGVDKYRNDEQDRLAALQESVRRDEEARRAAEKAAEAARITAEADKMRRAEEARRAKEVLAQENKRQALKKAANIAFSKAWRDIKLPDLKNGDGSVQPWSISYEGGGFWVVFAYDNLAGGRKFGSGRPAGSPFQVDDLKALAKYFEVFEKWSLGNRPKNVPGGVMEQITLGNPSTDESGLTFYFAQFAHLGSDPVLEIKPDSGSHMVDSDQAKLIKAALVVAGTTVDQRFDAAMKSAVESQARGEPDGGEPESKAKERNP